MAGTQSGQEQGSTTNSGNQSKTIGGMQRSAVLSKLPLICRVVTLSIGIICLGLIIDPINAKLQLNVNHAAMTYVAFAGFILINSVMILSEVAGEPLPKTAALLFAFTGGALYVTAGAIIINDWRHNFYSLHFQPPKMYMDMMIASGIIALFNAVFYFIDVGLTIRYAGLSPESDDEPDTNTNGHEKRVDEKRISTISTDQTDLSDFAV